jgi:hypothetical protein
MSALRDSQSVEADEDVKNALEALRVSAEEIVEMPRLQKPKYGGRVRETTIELPDVVQRAVIAIMHRENDEGFDEVMKSARRTGSVTIGMGIEGANVHAGFYVDNTGEAPQDITVSLVNLLSVAEFYHRNAAKLALKDGDDGYEQDFALKVLPLLVVGGKRDALVSKYGQLLSKLDLLECSHARYTFTLSRLAAK